MMVSFKHKIPPFSCKEVDYVYAYALQEKRVWYVRRRQRGAGSEYDPAAQRPSVEYKRCEAWLLQSSRWNIVPNPPPGCPTSSRANWLTYPHLQGTAHAAHPPASPSPTNTHPTICHSSWSLSRVLAVFVDPLGQLPPHQIAKAKIMLTQRALLRKNSFWRDLGVTQISSRGCDLISCDLWLLNDDKPG